MRRAQCAQAAERIERRRRTSQPLRRQSPLYSCTNCKEISPDGESSWVAHGVGAAGRIALHGSGALVHNAFALGARRAARHEVAWRQCAGATVGVALGQDGLYIQTVGGFVRLAVGEWRHSGARRRSTTSKALNERFDRARGQGEECKTGKGAREEEERGEARHRSARFLSARLLTELFRQRTAEVRISSVWAARGAL